jgi:perosamine synthetase
MTPLAQQLNGFLRQTLNRSGPIPLHEPWIRGNAWTYVKDCLDSGWVSSAGRYVGRFEKLCADACGVKHAIATANGTSALHAALLSAGVKPGDAVLCPGLSFVATANAIAYTGATPLFVDSDPVTLGMDYRDAARAFTAAGERRIAACVPMHVFGNPVDMDPLLDLCAERSVPVIEDAAEALGSSYKGRPAGSFGLAAALSFNGNKIVTTGGGGMILTNDDSFAERARHLTTTARTGKGLAFDHDEVGYNYRLPSLNAALGCAQMEDLSDFLSRKRALAGRYRAIFGDNWLNALLLDSGAERDAFLTETNAQGIETRPPWRLLSDLPMFTAAPRTGDLPVARSLVSRLINIPSSANLIEAA